jgi:hypothetical protein
VQLFGDGHEYSEVTELTGASCLGLGASLDPALRDGRSTGRVNPPLDVNWGDPVH